MVIHDEHGLWHRNCIKHKAQEKVCNHVLFPTCKYEGETEMQENFNYKQFSLKFCYKMHLNSNF